MPRGRIKSSQLVVGALAPTVQGASTMSVSYQADQDCRAIIRTLEEYSHAWFSGDAAAMERCLHPDLTARLLQLEPEEQGHPIYINKSFRGLYAGLIWGLHWCLVSKTVALAPGSQALRILPEENVAVLQY